MERSRLIPPFTITSIYSVLLLPIILVAFRQDEGIWKSLIFVFFGSGLSLVGHKIGIGIITPKQQIHFNEPRFNSRRLIHQLMALILSIYYASFGLVMGFIGQDFDVYGHSLPLYIDVIPGMAMLLFVSSWKNKKTRGDLIIGLCLLFVFLSTGRRTLLILTSLAFLFVLTDVVKIKWRQAILLGLVALLLSISGRLVRYLVVYDNLNKDQGVSKSLSRAFDDQLEEFVPLYDVVQTSDFFEVKDYALKSWIMWPSYFIPRFIWNDKPEIRSVGKAYVLYEKGSLSGSGTPIYLAGTLLYSGGWIIYALGSLCIGIISGILYNILKSKSIDKRFVFVAYSFWLIYFLRLGDLSVSITQVMILLIPLLILKIVRIRWI